jgi:hypothetical protein
MRTFLREFVIDVNSLALIKVRTFMLWSFRSQSINIKVSDRRHRDERKGSNELIESELERPSVTGTPVTTAYTVRGKRGSDLCSWITQERIKENKGKDSKIYLCIP